MSEDTKTKLLDAFNEFLMERIDTIESYTSNLINYVNNTEDESLPINDIYTIIDSIERLTNLNEKRACVPSYCVFKKYNLYPMYDEENDGVPCCFCADIYKESNCTQENCLFFKTIAYKNIKKEINNENNV